MDVLTLILACSVYPDDSLVRAMIALASQGNPHFVGDMTTLATFDKTKSASEADRVVAELLRRGDRPVVGLLGLPPTWAIRYGRRQNELYDGCVNIWLGTAVLASHHEACVMAHAALSTPERSDDRQSRLASPEAVRLCALRRFGADLGVDGYAEAVERLLPRQTLLHPPPALAPVFAPVLSRTADRGEPMCRCREDDARVPPALPPPKPHGPPPRLAPILD